MNKAEDIRTWIKCKDKLPNYNVVNSDGYTLIDNSPQVLCKLKGGDLVCVKLWLFEGIDESENYFNWSFPPVISIEEWLLFDKIEEWSEI
jgi:hypothetical protein